MNQSSINVLSSVISVTDDNSVCNWLMCFNQNPVLRLCLEALYAIRDQDHYCTCASAYNMVQNKLIKCNEDSNFGVSK